MGILQKKLEIKFPHNIAISLLGKYPKSPKTKFRKGAYTFMCIVALFTIPQNWKQPKCSNTDEWIKKIAMYIYTAIGGKMKIFVNIWKDLRYYAD